MSDDNRKNPGIKIPFLDITDKPIVEGTRCVEVRIPDDDKYMPVLAGLIAIATKWFNWQRDDLKRGAQIAKIWQLAYIETDWGSCMNCEELIACLQPVLDAQSDDIINRVTNIVNFSKYGMEAQPGVPMTPEQLETNLAGETNPTCDTEILCGQLKGVTDYLIQLVTDILEAAEAATNTVEFLDVLSSVTGFDELSLDTITGYMTFVQEAINEGFAAQVTEAYKESVTCALYCRTRLDCEVSPDDLYQVFRKRMEVHIGGLMPVFSTLVDLFQFLYGVPMDSTIIADTMLLIVTGGGVLANVFIGEVGTKSLSMLMALKADEPSDDCGILCTCPDTFLVAATVDPFVTDGVDSGFDAVSGTEILITAEGLWNGGAGGDVNADGFPPAAGTPFRDPASNTYELIFKIGIGGTWQGCGTEKIFTPPASGRLYFAMNDVPTGYGDNSGSLTVSIVET